MQLGNETEELEEEEFLLDALKGTRHHAASKIFSTKPDLVDQNRLIDAKKKKSMRVDSRTSLFCPLFRTIALTSAPIRARAKHKKSEFEAADLE